MACEGLSRGPSEELSTAPDVSFPPRTPSKALEQKDWPTFLPLSLSLSTPLPTHRSSPCSHPSPPPFLTQPPLLLCGSPAAVVRPESPAWMGLHTCVHTHHEQHTSLSLSPSLRLPLSLLPPPSIHLILSLSPASVLCIHLSHPLPLFSILSSLHPPNYSLSLPSLHSQPTFHKHTHTHIQTVSRSTAPVRGCVNPRLRPISGQHGSQINLADSSIFYSDMKTYSRGGRERPMPESDLLHYERGVNK